MHSTMFRHPSIRSFSKATLLFFSASMSCFTLASELDFRLSNDAVNVNFASSSDSSPLSIGLGHFYRDEGDAINITNLDIHTVGQTAIGNLPTTVLLGMQAVYMSEDKFKGSATAIGGTVRSNLPDTPGLSLEGTVYYAPDILSYGDSDSYARARAQLNYRVIENADLIGGYRYLRTGIKDAGHRTFESGVYIGLRMNF